MMSVFTRGLRLSFRAGLCAAVLASLGCGTMNSRRATEQLLVSDAVDRAVARIDFSDLAGQKVFLETKYIKNVKNLNMVEFVNEEYIVSALRQQLFAANCQVQDKPEEAEYIVEARVGAVGTDGHDVIYGLPANNGLNSAASLVTSTPALPSIPELSVAKRSQQLGAAKIGVFAYHRKTRTPVWQAGISQSRSTSKDYWVMGIGPFQKGTIVNGTQFAGAKLSLPLINDTPETDPAEPAPLAAYQDEIHFGKPLPEEKPIPVRPASAITDEPAAGTK